MINKNKMNDYARSMIFPEPNLQYGLNCRSSIKHHIKIFISGIYYNNRGLRKISYPERKSLTKRSFSPWYENGRALDDLVAKEIESFSWRSNVCNYFNKKVGLAIYSYICHKVIKEEKYKYLKNTRI